MQRFVAPWGAPPRDPLAVPHAFPPLNAALRGPIGNPTSTAFRGPIGSSNECPSGGVRMRLPTQYSASWPHRELNRSLSGGV
eukprot:5245554-Pyramimonas_sp.AAC.1